MKYSLKILSMFVFLNWEVSHGEYLLEHVSFLCRSLKVNAALNGSRTAQLWNNSTIMLFLAWHNVS